jgi:hypothetical protein
MSQPDGAAERCRLDASAAVPEEVEDDHSGNRRFVATSSWRV